MRVFLDANALFSAAAESSPTRALVSAASHYAELVSSSHAWEEARRNLQSKRPQYLPGLSSLGKLVRTTLSHVPVAEEALPDDDVPILAAAVASRCTHLWTGDRRHFGPWYGRELHGVTVLSATMLAEVLVKQGWAP